ncbi:pleckstrin homology domain-containing family O member 1b isoform X2 [Silurus meridionalis]|uniref:pleckstrin homology domain-containing family O member 1b isoform X2 n=1 Tax=Silurus meridionalis TaxID=175797 RepID=UPI001EECB75D|nr:pleckstrin homology domain-containing family O member 1b isoform X2 [Silurus meridionalis]XP_046703213.1 pleckstrin homology domain-containing family O member 1b isoform X2 [Silurus meridionalis]
MTKAMALQDSSQQPAQPDKVGWIRKYCGKGLFREIWKNRYVVLKGDKLYISEKEVKDEKKIQEVVDLTDYERSEELRKAKSRTKKNHSKFTLLCTHQPGNTVPNLVFLAVSPEEKESWINALNIAITRGKNRVLDENRLATCTAHTLIRRGKDGEDGFNTQSQVTVEGESCLVHPTRDRVKIPHTRRLPTRGHLLAVASTSTSDGMLTLDLIQEEDTPSLVNQNKSANSSVDTCKLVPDCEAPVKSQSLPRKCENSWTWCESQAQTPKAGKKFQTTDKNRCASMDEILSATKRSIPRCSVSAPAHSVCQLQELISLKLERTQELLSEARGHSQGHGANSTPGKEAERLLEEAANAWGQARDVLEEVKEIRVLCKQLEGVSSSSDKLKSPQQNQYRKSMM